MPAPSSIPFDATYGYLTFQLDMPAGSSPREPVTLDLYAADVAYVAAYTASPADPWEQFSEWLVSQGFPPHSRLNASRVYAACAAEIDRLKKADSGSGTPS